MLGSPPGDDQPPRVSYGLWRRRLQQYPGDLYPNSGTRRTYRSGAGMWIDHACANGLDPAQPDWAAVEEMFAASSLEDSTKGSYRSYIRWWFIWCGIKQAEWAKPRPFSANAG